MTLAPPHTQNEERPRGMGYGARLGDAWYRLAPSDEAPLQILTRDQLAERTQQGVNAFENMLKTGFAFIRANYSGGEGLDRYPRTPPGPLDDTRYFSSLNIDLRRPRAGRPYAITLANRYDAWYHASAPIVDAHASVAKLYLAAGDEMITFTADSDPSPDAVFTFPADVRSFDMSDSDEGIALLTSGELWHKPDETNTWTEVPPTATILDNLQAVWMVKGRVLAWRKDPISARPSVLVEIGLGVAGTPAVPTYLVTETVIDTFAADILGVEDGGMCVLVCTSDRQIRAFSLESESAGDAPVLTLRSMNKMPVGEQPIAVAHNSGRLIILTAYEDTLRAYSGTMLDARFNHTIGDLAQIRQWEGIDTSYDATLRRIVAARDEFLWLVSTDGGSTDLWRYDMETTGIHRHTEVSASGQEGIAGWANRVYTYQRGETVMSRATVLYQASGWLITPLVNFNINTDINWTDLTLQAFDVVPAQGVQVEISVSSIDEAILDVDHPSWRVVARLTNPTVEVAEVPLLDVVAPKLALRIRLYGHSNGTGSPRITQVGVRGIPAAQEVLVSVPMSCADQVEAPGRMPMAIPGFGDVLFDSLMDQRGRSLELRLVSPPLTIRGVVLEVGTPVTYMTHRGSVGRYTMVQVLGDTLDPSESEIGLGGAGMGVGLLGVTLLGVGEE